MQATAKSRGGECLSTEYINSASKLRWQCSEKHEWEMRPNNIRNGQWCPECAYKRNGALNRLSINEMQDIAKTHGGKCLSTEYHDNKTNLEWQCEKGHMWKMTASSAKNQGSWCSICAGRAPLTIEEMQMLAKSKGGVCLSKTYVNSKTNLQWRCNDGHTWSAAPDSIKYQDSWCPICRQITIEDLQVIAKSRGGKCLSTSYVDMHIKLQWECVRGHTWCTSPINIKYRGAWCPYCKERIRERTCRLFFERFFEKKFLKCRPDWLVNSTGNRMELDGYCQELKMAFEYQGEQHSTNSPAIFHKVTSLKKRKMFDEEKRVLCKKQGIELIEISHHVDFHKMGEYILSECKNRRLNLQNENAVFDFSPTDIYAEDKIGIYQEIAKKRGGFCLTEHYYGYTVKLKFRCKEGHEFEMNTTNVKRSWCPVCAHYVPLTIEEMQSIANSRRGKCLSKDYVNNYTKLNWECEKKHAWWAEPSHIKRGRWCPICGKSGQRLSIESMRSLALSRSGKCLSETYVNDHTKLMWECVRGHRWSTTPHTVLRGCWCPVCKTHIFIDLTSLPPRDRIIQNCHDNG